MIGVIGDSQLDVYFHGQPGEWDPGVDGQSYRIATAHTCLGCAANVAAAVAAHGTQVRLFSAVGRDGAGKEIETLLDRWKIDRKALVPSDRSTRIAVRLINEGRIMPIRLDFTGDIPLCAARVVQFTHSNSGSAILAGASLERIADFEGMIVADYGGLLSRALALKLVRRCTDAGLPTLVDPTHGNPDWYVGCTIIKVNHEEMLALTRRWRLSYSDIESAAQYLRERLHAKIAIITLAARGAIAVTKTEVTKVETRVLQSAVQNPIGAGDAFGAIFMVEYSKCGDIRQSMSKAVEAADRAVTTICTCPTVLLDRERS